MRMDGAEAPLSPHSPIRVFVLVLLLVFAVEGTIMLLLPQLPARWRGPVVEGLLDAGTLTLIMAPAVWFLAVLPLQQSFEARGRLLQRLLESQEQERARIARDLHDGIGQHLTALMVGLRTVEEAPDFDSARSRARGLRASASLAHGEVRRLARGLRPSILEELGLTSALEQLCEDFQKAHGVKAILRCDIAAGRRLAPSAETALYRILQEALTNVARHADASLVEVTLRQEEASMSLSIRDDGGGFPPEGGQAPSRKERGFGLGSIRERALMLGGVCEVNSSRGRGTEIEVRVPRRT